MNINAMLAREDFYNILQRTMQTYFSCVRNRPIRFAYEPFDEGEPLRIFGVLGYIARNQAPQGARTYLNHEFNVRGSLPRYLGAKALVFLATHGTGFGSVRNCYITKNALNGNAFISPQNRSVRVFDYDEMTVDCILKQGFSDSYFQRQLQFRTDCDYDFVPPILTAGEQWYREGILCGHALARVTNNKAYRNAVATALADMRIIAQDSLQRQTATQYLAPLVARLQAMLQKAAEEKAIQNTAFLRRLVCTYAEQIGDFEIPTVCSHGDLQTGNIWLDEQGKVWIYDWETVKRRSVWYDSATLLYATRRAGGLERMLAQPCTERLCACAAFDEYAPQALQKMARLVILEDMEFYLEDLLELPEAWGAEIFNRFTERLRMLPEEEKN